MIAWFRRRKVACRLGGRRGGIGGGRMWCFGWDARLAEHGLAEEFAWANDGDSSLSSNTTRVTLATPAFPAQPPTRTMQGTAPRLRPRGRSEPPSTLSYGSRESSEIAPGWGLSRLRPRSRTRRHRRTATRSGTTPRGGARGHPPRRMVRHSAFHSDRRKEAACVSDVVGGHAPLGRWTRASRSSLPCSGRAANWGGGGACGRCGAAGEKKFRSRQFFSCNRVKILYKQLQNFRDRERRRRRPPGERG